MMRYLIIFLFLFASCSTQDGESYNRKNERNSALQEYLKMIPPYTTFIYTPEDTLLFGFSKGALNDDTSWTLLVRKSQGVNHCRYNQLLPYTVTGFDDYLDETTKLLYYEGFSFEIDSQRWNEVINLSGLNNYVVRDSVRYGGCLHCPRYTAYYNSKLIVSSKLDTEFLTSLDSLLRKEVIDNLFEKKRHPPIQFKK